MGGARTRCAARLTAPPGPGAPLRRASRPRRDVPRRRPRARIFTAGAKITEPAWERRRGARAAAEAAAGDPPAADEQQQLHYYSTVHVTAAL